MTPDAFDALAELLRMTDGPVRDAARRVLVDGELITRAAEVAGVSRQSCGNAVKRCRAGLELAKRAAAGG